MKMNLLLATTALGALLLAAALPIACTDEGEAISGPAPEGAGGAEIVGAGATGTGGSGGGAAGTGGAGGAGGMSSGTGSTDGGLPDGALDECLMQVDVMDVCGVCACNNCLQELYDCNMDQGCIAIRDCARMNMCSGIGCLGPCGMIIDMYGGVGGTSAGLGLALSTCTEMQCTAECAPMP